MKLTQGTSRGTCLWNNFILMTETIFILFLNSTSEDLLILLFLFSVFNYICIVFINEIIWITQIFNKKFANFKYKKFNDIFVKLNIFTLNKYFINLF